MPPQRFHLYNRRLSDAEEAAPPPEPEEKTKKKRTTNPGVRVQVTLGCCAATLHNSVNILWAVLEAKMELGTTKQRKPKDRISKPQVLCRAAGYMTASLGLPATRYALHLPLPRRSTDTFHALSTSTLSKHHSKQGRRKFLL